jgi:hypothetical protein
LAAPPRICSLISPATSLAIDHIFEQSSTRAKGSI